MDTETRRFKLSASAIEWITVTTVLAITIALAVFGVWFFRSEPHTGDASLAGLILSDRVSLGFVRLLTAVAAVYAIASVIVLVMRGRWLRSLSTTGFEVDDLSRTDRLVDELRARVEQLKHERDEARQLLWRYMRG